MKRIGLAMILAGIFWLSHRPSLRLLPPLFPLQDKLFHAVEFFILGVAIHLNRDIFPRSGRWLAMAAAGIFWAVLDEIHQSFIVGRDCSWGDFLADCVGLVAALILYGRTLNSGEEASLKREDRPPAV
jgi:VanZ family protein